MQHMSIGVLEYSIAGTYLALCFIKMCLMLGTFPTAAATHYRIARRNGSTASRIRVAVGLLIWLIITAFFFTPVALYRERWRFFSVYSRRETMQDVVRGYRGVFN